MSSEEFGMSGELIRKALVGTSACARLKKNAGAGWFATPLKAG
jgi:hypothetical protein